MSLEFLKQLAGATAAGFRSDNFTAGAGRLILKDAKLFKGFDDPQTLVVEFVVKESRAIRDDVKPNAPGTTVGYVKKLNKKYEKERAKTVLCILMGMPPTAPDAEVFSSACDLLRIDPATGYTKDGTECPDRGLEVIYSTFEQDTKDKTKKLTLPKFELVKYANPKEMIAATEANKKVLDGMEKAA